MTTELTTAKKVVYRLRMASMKDDEYIPLTENEGEAIKKIILNGNVKFIELSNGHLLNINMISSIQKLNTSYE